MADFAYTCPVQVRCKSELNFEGFRISAATAELGLASDCQIAVCLA